MKYIVLAAALLTTVGVSAASAQRFEGRGEGYRERREAERRCEYKRGELRRFEYRANRDGRIDYRERERISELRRQVAFACAYRR